MEHMLWIGETTATLEKIYSLEEIINEVNRINKEDILKCARFLFKEDNLNLSLIGPLKGAEDKISERLNLS
ncbi:MAG: hypothetical protein WC293_02650, partial [Candidatus Omnitrophota bacterium]|jgi:predicted Zn-dependent peptidase